MPSHDTYEDINNEIITIININETSSNEEDKIKLYIVEISMILIIIIFRLLINKLIYKLCLYKYSYKKCQSLK